MKKATIIVINYNDKERVQRAIRSATNQTWKNTEVIVVDDGSNKETREVYEGMEGFFLLQLERDDVARRTPSRARNAGIRAATGDYVCFLDSDNYYANDFIESLIKFEADVRFCNWEIVGKQNYKCDIEKVWQPNQPILQNYLQFQHVDHQCMLIKRSKLDEVGFYDERLPRSQDCDLIVRLILSQATFQHVPQRLFTFEKHEDDQMKQYASIHGKALWSLKNNVNLGWMAGMMRDPNNILSVARAIEDFSTVEEWAETYEKSEFKAFYENHGKLLSIERQEKLDG
jgi:glycosyltransferase involved in cell wall biosynthesis